MNQVPFSGSLFGRPLAPGRYAIVLEAVTRGKRVVLGRVLVVVRARHGREGRSRYLAAPVCGGGDAVAAFVASLGDGVSGLLGPSASGVRALDGTQRPAGGSGGVAGVSAARSEANEGTDLPLLPNLPALPPLPSIAPDDFAVPGWALPALGVLAALAAAAAALVAIRRRREYAAWD